MPSVLIVDDLPSIHEMLEAVIQPIGFSAAFATDGQKALERYKSEKFDIVLTDVRMKPMDGLSLLKEIKRIDSKATVIMMTGFANTEMALDALKSGAFDFLQKPFKVDELVGALKRANEFRQLGVARAATKKASSTSAAAATTSTSAGSETLEAIVLGESKAIKRVALQIKKLISSKTPILITGEPGTGKKTVAELIHSHAPTGTALVRYDCAQISEEDLRAGLIGNNSQGGSWIEEAKNGILFIEHIHTLPLEIQQGFASVLKQVGSTFRLICTTDEDIEKLIDAGKFRDDLYYRIATLPLALPALRERIEDLPVLVKNFVHSVKNPLFDSTQIEFSAEAMSILTAYPWPGNIAELNQIIHRVVSETDTKVITPEHLPERVHDLKAYLNLATFLQEQQRNYINRVLTACGGNKTKAAKILAVEEATLT